MLVKYHIMIEKPAPFLRRILALLYDSLLVTAILFLATFLILLPRDGQSFGPNHLGYMIYLLVWASPYFIWCWTHGGQTLGMKAWRLKILSSNLTPLTYKQAGTRYLWGVVGFWLFGLGLLWSLVDSKRQSLADRLAKTTLFLVQ